MYLKGDLPLSQKLSEELKYEKESAANDDAALVPAFLQAFKNSGTWSASILPDYDHYASR